MTFLDWIAIYNRLYKILISISSSKGWLLQMLLLPQIFLLFRRNVLFFIQKKKPESIQWFKYQLRQATYCFIYSTRLKLFKCRNWNNSPTPFGNLFLKRTHKELTVKQYANSNIFSFKKDGNGRWRKNGNELSIPKTWLYYFYWRLKAENFWI